MVLVGLWFGVEFSALAAFLLPLLFLAGGVGAGIGLHRFFSHHSFETSSAGRWVLGILGSWAWQGPIEQWVADHRRHHRYADTPLDPHSPHWVGDRPARSRVQGLIHAHLAWMIFGDVSDPSKYAADIRNDRISATCSRAYWPLAASTILLPGAIGYALGGWPEALSCGFWAGIVRVAAIQHLTWAIASLGHTYGQKVPESKDESRNNTLLAALLFGEGLHSYHHAHPTAAICEPPLLDTNGRIITALERAGLVWGVKRT